MVGFTRVGRIAKDPQAAIAFAVEINTYIKEKYNESATCWARSGGPVGTIVWQARFEDMPALEKFQQGIMGNQEYWAKVKAGEGLFDAGSFEDAIWTQIG